MNNLINHKNFVIYDNILSPEELEQFYLWGQNLKYKKINEDGEFMKIWRVTDGSPIASVNTYNASNFPFNENIDRIIETIKEISKKHTNIFGEYEEIYFRSYVYGRGSKIDWHTDHGYKSAAIFYYHPYWGSNWGGELRLAELPDIEYSEKNVGGPMDNRWIDKIISTTNFGYYIDPKPNRIIGLKSGVWHSINRIDENAGCGLRFSVVAFFK